MIVPMKKITVVCTAHDRQAALEKLQEAGAMHLLVDTASHRFHTTDEQLTEVEEAVAALNAEKEVETTPASEQAIANLIETWRILKAAEKHAMELQTLVAKYEPWGNFDAKAIKELQNQEWFIQLFEWPLSKPLPEIEQAVWREVAPASSIRRLALVSRKQVSVSEPPVLLPEKPLTELIVERNAAHEALKKASASFFALSSNGPAFAVWLAEQRNRRLIEKLSAAMEASGPLSWITGFIPQTWQEVFDRLAKENQWALLLEDPAPEDEPPTLLSYPKWIQPIKVVLDAINVSPGYREADPGVLFLIFFSVFFAMLIGDAGYGLLFLGLTFIGKVFAKKMDPVVFRLLMITSGATVIWGALSGCWFGITTGLGLMEQVKIDWLQSNENVMQLCFLLGAVHLTFAHGWNIIRMAPAPAALAQAGWVALTWVMYFLANSLVLQKEMPSWVMPLFGAGAVLIALFMTPLKQLKDEWYGHVMLPLNFVSHFVDVVSYLRLFAVGAASLAVAGSFNAMALKGGVPDIVSGIIAAFILFAGHTLNIVLGAMGVLVHGVRLNTLEFSSHLGVQWTGKSYNPFRRSA
jgi:V/A-type H+-transporting ATPase subunit I